MNGKGMSERYVAFDEAGLLKTAEELENGGTVNGTQLAVSLSKLCKGMVALRQSQMTPAELDERVDSRIRRYARKWLPWAVVALLLALQTGVMDGIRVFGLLKMLFK